MTQRRFKDFLKFTRLDNTATIFEAFTPNYKSRLILLGLTFLTGGNFCLIYKEKSKQVLGKLSIYSSYFVSVVGVFAIAYFSVIHRRVLQQIKLFKDFKTIEITFYSAFRKQRVLKIPIRDLSTFKTSVLGFSTFDSHTVGRIWINLSDNQMNMYPGATEFLENILNGNEIQQTDAEKKLKKYKK